MKACIHTRHPLFSLLLFVAVWGHLTHCCAADGTVESAWTLCPPPPFVIPRLLSLGSARCAAAGHLLPRRPGLPSVRSRDAVHVLMRSAARLQWCVRVDGTTFGGVSTVMTLSQCLLLAVRDCVWAQAATAPASARHWRPREYRGPCPFTASRSLRMCADVDVRALAGSCSYCTRVVSSCAFALFFLRENGEDILSPPLHPSQDGCSPMTFA